MGFTKLSKFPFDVAFLLLAGGCQPFSLASEARVGAPSVAKAPVAEAIRKKLRRVVEMFIALIQPSAFGLLAADSSSSNGPRRSQNKLRGPKHRSNHSTSFLKIKSLLITESDVMCLARLDCQSSHSSIQMKSRSPDLLDLKSLDDSGH